MIVYFFLKLVIKILENKN